jgi:hypothetical protein
MSRKGLDIGSLEDFKPRRDGPSEEHGRKPTSHLEKTGTGWSRREAPQEGQFTIRARLETIERFKQLCRPPGGGRFTYGEMLEILMNKAEGQD